MLTLKDWFKNKKIIHLDRVGFIMGREARDNTLKTIPLMEYTQKHHIPPFLVSVDIQPGSLRTYTPTGGPRT